MIKENLRYAAVVRKGKTVDGFSKAFQESGYATDPNYGKKVRSIAGHRILRNLTSKLVL